MSEDDAKLLDKIATQWCESRVNHPDCEALNAIKKKLKIDQM